MLTHHANRAQALPSLPDEQGLIRWTRFASVTDTRGTEQVSTWEAFAEMLRTSPPRAAGKRALPLLKLATFNGPRSSATVAEVFGLEGDHDGGTMSAGEAIQRLERHGIRAVVYSTPSSTAERPRWRVLAPLARPHLPAERARLVARLNGALGGVLAAESFTLAQVFYVGAVEGVPYACIQTFDEPDEGSFIDELHELDEIAVWPTGKASQEPSPPVVATAEAGTVYLPPGTVADLRDALSRIPSDDRDLWVRFCLALRPCGQQGWDLWDEWSRKSAKYDPVDAARVWHTAKPRGEVNYESIFAVAAQHGWVNPLAGGAVQASSAPPLRGADAEELAKVSGAIEAIPADAALVGDNGRGHSAPKLIGYALRTWAGTDAARIAAARQVCAQWDGRHDAPAGAVQAFDAGKLDVPSPLTVASIYRLAGEHGWSHRVWAEPTPLPNDLPPVAPFDAELLPQALRGWVADIAHRMQCPPDFPAVGALVAISSLIGARAVVAPKARDDWRVVPNLWGLIVGRPGVMKSPALGEALKPLHRLEATEREQWRAAHDAWELDCKVAALAAETNEKEARRLAAKDPAKARALLEPVDTPAEPKARRYVVNDATVEKLGEILESNPWGTLSYRDEIHGLLCSLDRQGQEGARAFYLQAYDGNQGYTVDRIIRGTHYIPRVCLAMLGGIQPGKVQSYVREAVAGGAGDDGLLQRFGLAVWPDVSREFAYVDKWPDTHAKQVAWAVFERLNQLQPASDTDPHEWRFSPEAQALFVEWLEPFETEIRGEELHPALVSHLAKYRKLIPALALLFALVDTPDSGGVIHERELLRALAWGDYLRTHAERLYAAAVIPETAGARLLLDKIKAGKLTDGDGVLLDAFTPRLVAVKHWSGLSTTDAVRKAADLLADYGWLAREAVSTGAAGGRPSDRYLIHPMLLKGGA